MSQKASGKASDSSTGPDKSVSHVTAGISKQIYIGIYAAMLAIANVAAVKVITVEGWTITAGVFPIAIAFLMSDLIVETYGRRVGHRTVWAGVVALLITIVLTQFVVYLPGESPVNAVFSAALPVLLASITTVVVSQHVDVFLFTWIKNRLPYRPTRNIGSTTLSQLLDTTLFTLLAFQLYPVLFGGQTLPLAAIATIIITEWTVKTALSIIDTPAFLLLTE